VKRKRQHKRRPANRRSLQLTREEQREEREELRRQQRRLERLSPAEFKQAAKRGEFKLVKRRKPPRPVEWPSYNLCRQPDRERFYDQVISDFQRTSARLSPEEASALRVVVDIIGKPKRRQTKTHRKSRRRTTAFIGERTWSDLRRFKRFLLLDTEHESGRTGDNPFGVNWSSTEGLCQFEKTAKIVIFPERGRGRTRVFKRYKLTR